MAPPADTSKCLQVRDYVSTVLCASTRCLFVSFVSLSALELHTSSVFPSHDDGSCVHWLLELFCVVLVRTNASPDLEQECSSCVSTLRFMFVMF